MQQLRNTFNRYIEVYKIKYVKADFFSDTYKCVLFLYVFVPHGSLALLALSQGLQEKFIEKNGSLARSLQNFN